MNGGGAGMRTGRLTDKTEGTFAGVFAPAFFRFGSAFLDVPYIKEREHAQDTCGVHVRCMGRTWDSLAGTC